MVALEVHESKSRPILKGVFHLCITMLYVCAFPILVLMIPPGLEMPLVLYLFAVIANFGSSTLFHLIKWPPEQILYARRLDHVMIFLKIAATYYAIMNIFASHIESFVMYIVLGGTIIGILVRLFFTQAPKYVIACPYIIIGWALIFDPHALMYMAQELPLAAILAVIAGLSYTTGAVIYMCKYPRACPKYMGYHELFHICTIIGALLLTITIFAVAVPYYERIHKT